MAPNQPNTVVDNSWALAHSKNEKATPAPHWSDLTQVRLIFYVHMVAITLCAILVAGDTRQLQIPDFIAAFLKVAGIPLFVSWMLFPLAMMIAASRLRNRTAQFRFAVVVGDIFLSMFQAWVLLPLVQ